MRWRPATSGRIADPHRFSNEVLCDQSVKNEQNDARDEKEERERGDHVEFGPKLFPLRAARGLLVRQVIRLVVFRQADDWTVNKGGKEKHQLAYYIYTLIVWNERNALEFNRRDGARLHR